MTSQETLSRLIVAIDFGTTFSSVACARVTESMCSTDLGLADVHCVARYPDDRPYIYGPMAWEPREDVPTELWYPRSDVMGRPGPNSCLMEHEMAEEHAVGQSPLSSDLEPSSDEDELPTASSAPAPALSDDTSRPYWGFEVQRQLRRIDEPKDNMSRIARFKLMLDEKNKKTEGIRKELSHTLKVLKRSKQIEENTDVITAYLLQLFLHTKRELQAWHDFTDRTPIEFVLCVPAVWPSKACRIMQSAMSVAAQKSGLRSSYNADLSNLFIISEPEAAAACVLEENQNDIFVCSVFLNDCNEY